MGLPNALVTRAGLAALPLLLTLAGGAAPTAEGGARVLPDGTRLTLLGTTYGTTHRLGDQSLETEQPALVFWIRRESAPNETWTARKEAFDVSGCRFPLGSHGNVAMARAPREPRPETIPFALTRFPRRGKTVGLRLFDSGPRDEILWSAEWSVPNPLRGPFRQWKAEALPALRALGDVRLTLTDIATLPARRLEPSAEAGAVLTRARFRLERGGQGASDWEPVRATLADATGNVLEERNPARGASHLGAARFDLDGGLCPGEPGLLRVEWARKRGARFGPDELWTVRGLPIPPVAGRSVSHAGATRQGVRLRLLGAAGARGPAWPMSVTGHLPHLFLQTSRLPAGVRVTWVRAVDQRGRNVPLFYPTPAAGGVTCGFQPPPGARTLDLTLAVHRTRWTEFKVRPVSGDRTARPAARRG